MSDAAFDRANSHTETADLNNVPAKLALCSVGIAFLPSGKAEHAR
jgi:hypothetical protein